MRPCPLLTQSGHRPSDRDKADGCLEEDRCFFYHPCFAMRLGGVSGGKDTQGWRDSSHTTMVGAGKFGSAKLPMATATYPGSLHPPSKRWTRMSDKNERSARC